TVLPSFISLDFGGRSLQPGFGGGFTYMNRFTIEYRNGNLGRSEGVGNPFGYNYPFQTITAGYIFLQKKD
ncbi:MAG: hypothetical protein AAFO69_13030, partial [Bacteroidota bacterium]